MFEWAGKNPPECERCESKLKPSCQGYCHLHKMMVAERGYFSAIRQSQDQIKKAVRSK